MSAAEHLLRRIAKEARLAWYFDPATEAMELLTREYCEANGLNLEEFRAKYYKTLQFERPSETK